MDMLLRAVVFVLAVLLLAPAQAAVKVALLIGNAAYADSASTLRNPPNDVAALRSVLEAADFEVTVVENAGRAAMSRALSEFSETAAQAEIGLIYYSGHGIEMNGENFLMPVDATLESDVDVEYETVALGKLVDALSGVKKFKLVLVDACRDNPLFSKMKRPLTRGGATKGLARIESTQSNLLIGFATSPGEIALDGEGDSSPYASALARHLVTPGREVEVVLRSVAKDVFEATKGKQRPYITGSLFETVILGREAEEAPATVDPCRDAAVHWQAVSSRGNVALLEEHVRLFPSCAFASLAKVEIEELLKSSAEQATTESISVAAGLTVKQAFDQLAQDARLDGDLPAELPAEGALMPGTYALARGATRADVVRQMQVAQAELIGRIWAGRQKGLPLENPEQLVILASIIERETGLSADMPKFAAVFVNRLNKGMRLQSDATMIYGLFGGDGKPVGRAIRRADLETKTPYNTYQIPGLPPTPIALPGQASLEAAANPAATDDLYFVPDGNGGHAFAATLAEHNVNVSRWRKLAAETRVKAE
ncbi:endolytic transglycosylase MltG [Shinella sp.]|uniref:endolytic transglycosylase MltG n=1 Tax=Shinella sp. TaxID=1870904 RepID=UPI003F724823